MRTLLPIGDRREQRVGPGRSVETRVLENDRLVATNGIGERKVAGQLDTAEGRWIIELDVPGSAGADSDVHRADRISVLEVEGEGELCVAHARVEHAGSLVARHAGR